MFIGLAAILLTDNISSSCKMGNHNNCHHPNAVLTDKDNTWHPPHPVGPCACPCHKPENKTRFPEGAEL